MLASDVVMNLAKIMLILNSFYAAVNKVDALISPSTSAGKQHELKIMQEENHRNDEDKLHRIGMDFLNIRHERSKQRRHATNTAINEQQQQPMHISRKLYDYDGWPENKSHLLNEQKNVAAVAANTHAFKNVGNMSDEQQTSLLASQELNKYLQTFHLSKSIDDINTAGQSINSTIIHNVFGNVTSNWNDVKARRHSNSTSNSNRIIIHADASNIEDTLQTTVATTTTTTAHHSIHLIASTSLPTTTLKAVTHKIRKLHKKKIVESLRQLHIDKSNTNGGNGHLTKNHRRSLLEAEHLQQQQEAHLKDINTSIHSRNDNDDISRQQQEKTNYISNIITNSSSNHLVVKGTHRNRADETAFGVDSIESVNDDNDLTHVMNRNDNDDDGDDDDDVSDRSINKDDCVEQTNDDVSYQNDENNLNDSIGDDVDNSDVVADDNDDGGDNVEDIDHDIDVSFATTLDSLLDDKFDKKFKNFSSKFFKDIDNSVDLEDNETEIEAAVAAWQQVKNINFKSLNLLNTSRTANISNISNNSPEDSISFGSLTPTELVYNMPVSSERIFLQPLLSASTSQAQPASLANGKERRQFNYSSDLLQEDNYSSKELVRDEAASDDENSAAGSVFNLSDLEELEEPVSDSEADTETEGTAEVTSGDGDTNHFLEGVVDAANSEEIYDWDEISRSNRRDLMHGRDVVTRFLQIVETQHSLGSNCEAGTSLNLGEGVVDRYAQDRFRIEAEVAVNRANMLTRIFKMTSSGAQADVNLLHASVLSMVEFDDDIFAAGNCFDWNEHPSQPGLFCPFAYRLPPPNLGAILAKDLAMEYHYLGNTSEWFFQARKNAEKVIAHNEQYLKAFHLYSNRTDERIEDDTLAVKYEDGRWSKPYYDCGGGNIWMLTYTVPFFGYENSTYHFKGTSGIDIDLRRVDIDQCPQHTILGSTKPLNIFAGTDKCKQRTTMCEAIQGLGFRRGSYKCICRKGYYFPDITSQHKYFNGSLLEEEYEKLMLGKNSTYNIVNEYECLPCAEGCDFCEDSSPCIAALNWPMRTSILALACVVIGLLPPAAWFTFRYQQVKVVRAASPALLRVIALGAFFIYCTNIVMYPNPNLYTCTARIWLREIGFSLTYGALMLKTWRISVIFRVRSAKAVKITDAALLKRLGCICGAIGTCLLVRTLVSPPDVVVGRTADDLKAFLCKTDWWDYTFTSMEVVFLAWGVRLCIMVRKAPSEFNESRFISMAIYNEFLLTCFLNVSMLFLQSPANPDLLYIIFFCHTQLTITLLLALIFGSKVYIVLRSGKSHQENINMGAKSSGAKFNFRPQVRTFANPSSVTTSTAPVAATTSAETKLSDQEALEEIRQLSKQLQRIQEMAPPKGVAVMTISSLLDGLRTPTNLAIATATQSAGNKSLHANQLNTPAQRPEALALLSLNSEMQKYQQLKVPQQIPTAATTMILATTTTTTTTTTSTTNNNNVAVIRKSMPSTQESVTKSTSTKSISGIGRWEEKAVNTEIVGNCIAEEKLKQQHQQHLDEHIICQRCYERCKSQQHQNQQSSSSAKLDKCKMLGSPQQEGSISFKNIKLDCMCSQSDDLDQLSERELPHTIRRISKRTAATNTPPSTTRKRAHGHTTSLQPTRDGKARSSVSLPNDEGQHHQQPKQQQQQQQQQICDNCRNKFKRKKESQLHTTPKQQRQQQHRKLSRLSSKCNKLLADVENSQGIHLGIKATTFQEADTKPQQQNQYDCDEEAQYSTDDIIFYTTTDTDDSDDDDDDNDDADETEDEEKNVSDDDNLSLNLSHSRSESRMPLKLKPHLAAIELKCISLSLGNITATTTTTTTTSSTSQPDSTKSKNALLEPITTTIKVTTSTVEQPAATSAATSHQQTLAATPTPTQTQTQQTASTQPPTNNSSNGNNNGKAKRPDKLVLNLNDRSKFTKEVSV